MRILVLSHGHPELGAGGGERAAYALFQRLKQDAAIEQVIFVARAEHDAIGHSAYFGAFRGRPDEILIAPPPVGTFTFQSLQLDVLKQLIDELIALTRPDVVHIHHFLFWGIEVFELFREAGVRVVFTMHEYAAICAHYGQMVKSDGRLCYAASPAECSLCLPSASAGRFFVRNTLLKTGLGFVDQFIAPSHFLKERYVAWGMPAEPIAVIDNLVVTRASQRAQGAAAPLSDAPIEPNGRSRRRTVFGFFANITPFKGLDLLLEACTLLPAHMRDGVEIRVHGENAHYREGEFARRVERLLEQTRDVVLMMGPYRHEDGQSLMAGCDWIVVPSIWWENSPLVFQEARLAARPVICANIGGMAEKVDPGVDLIFAARSAGALADVLAEAASRDAKASAGRLTHLAQSWAAADEIRYTQHTALYESLLCPEDVTTESTRIRATLPFQIVG